VCGERQRVVDQAKAQGNSWDTGVVPGPRTLSGGAEFRHCRRSEGESIALELWAKGVLTMGQPIDANGTQDFSVDFVSLPTEHPIGPYLAIGVVFSF